MLGARRERLASRCLFATLLAVLAVTIPGCVRKHDATKLSAVDLEGRSVNPLQDERARAVVLIFAKTDCPISNRYAPEVRRLYEKFSAKGVVFWLVYCDPDESADAIRAHLQDYGYRMGALRDLDHALVKATGVHVTPEAAVFVPHRSGADLVYRGRIDDRYVDFGRMRTAPTVNDLDRALEAILEGRRVPARRTEAVGCFIPERP